ncbi:MAG: hypothetical protein HON04_14885, partial [Planctomicrobium sp.]|nr:hypothetical protein [Planctomicrobium sp.]
PQPIELLSTESDEGDEPLIAEFYNETVPDIELVEEISPEVSGFTPPELAALPAIEAIVIDQERLDQVKQYRTQAASLADKIAKLKATQEELTPGKANELKTLEEGVADLTQAKEKLQTLLKLIEISTEENRRSQQVVDQLLEKKEQTEEEEPETETLAHKLNPVGKQVSGKEVHFRLIGNEISFVPVHQLSELVKRDMLKRREFLLKQQRFQSRVGPVNGYEMEYLVQRESGGIFDEARYGTGRIRVSVTDWILRPSGEVFSEALDDAIEPGSQFRSALLSEGTNATITFWVYPDSFELHRQLKQMVHDSGFWVASRPLPMGYPIAGSSTNGSKSIAQ